MDRNEMRRSPPPFSCRAPPQSGVSLSLRMAPSFPCGTEKEGSELPGELDGVRLMISPRCSLDDLDGEHFGSVQRPSKGLGSNDVPACVYYYGTVPWAGIAGQGDSPVSRSPVF